jgi:hypothetical protein
MVVRAAISVKTECLFAILKITLTKTIEPLFGETFQTSISTFCSTKNA